MLIKKVSGRWNGITCPLTFSINTFKHCHHNYLREIQPSHLPTHPTRNNLKNLTMCPSLYNCTQYLISTIESATNSINTRKELAMFCPNCGSQIKENAHFCPKCGTHTHYTFRSLPTAAGGAFAHRVPIPHTTAHHTPPRHQPPLSYSRRLLIHAVCSSAGAASAAPTSAAAGCGVTLHPPQIHRAKPGYMRPRTKGWKIPQGRRPARPIRQTKKA